MTENKKNSPEFTPKQQEIVDQFVAKTFSTGYGVNPSEQTGAAALRPESLDENIELLTYSLKDLDFFHRVVKRPASSTVEQYTVLTQRGGDVSSLFVSELDIAKVTDPSLKKKAVRMKFLSSTKQLSLASQLVENIADPINILTDDAIVQIAKGIEWGCFYGDSDLSADGTPGAGLQFDGLAKLIDRGNVIDAGGNSLTEELLNHAAVLVAKGYSTPTDAYMPLGVHADFVNQYLSRQVQVMNMVNPQMAETGFNIPTFSSARGRVNLHGSAVMELENILDIESLDVHNAPLEPKVTASIAAKAGGKFSKEGDITDYVYRVVTVGSESQSKPSKEVKATVTAATDGVKLAIAPQNMYQQTPQFVKIYRQGETTGQFYLIGQVAASEMNEDGVIEFIDKNEVLPETTDVFIGEMAPSIIHLFELLPMTRIPLAQHNATHTFTVLWYGALALRKPKAWVRIKNVRYIPVSDPHGINLR